MPRPTPEEALAQTQTPQSRTLFPATSARRRSNRRQHGSRGNLGLAVCLAVAAHANSALALNVTSNDPNRPIPLVVTNSCPDTVWPAITTQNGVGPGTGGFELVSGNTSAFFVSPNWQGRVWGRTNCSFNANGTGPSNLNGVNGAGAACLTGDCGSKLSCDGSGATPVTLFEANLMGGVSNDQTFYDISLVDGYNIPLGCRYLPAENTSFIPPNLVNAACIATSGFLADPVRSGNAYSNSTYPIPYESRQTNQGISRWCPWDLQVYPPEKPGDGVFPYPDDNIQRPVFDPCLSACAKTNAPSDCCTGDYGDPSSCKAGLYSQSAKAVCPDAYSFAYDDQTSTFIIPSGGGWEVIFCPAGRSTNILQTFGAQLGALAASGVVSNQTLADVTNVTYIATHPDPNAGEKLRPATALVALSISAAVALLVLF